jgi:hypothetical protein
MTFELERVTGRTIRSTLLIAMTAIVMMAGPEAAIDAVSAGMIEDLDAEKQDFVLMDNAGKDSMVRLI